MATKKGAAPAAPAKATGKKINRTRRNALERKCLPKCYKVLFAGESRSTFRMILAAWKESRRKNYSEAQ